MTPPTDPQYPATDPWWFGPLALLVLVVSVLLLMYCHK